MTDLAKYLKAARINAGLKQGEAAELLNYSCPQFISNWERGISMPPHYSINALSKIYKINPQDLLKKVAEQKAELKVRAFVDKYVMAGK